MIKSNMYIFKTYKHTVIYSDILYSMASFDAKRSLAPFFRVTTPMIQPRTKEKQKQTLSQGP